MRVLAFALHATDRLAFGKGLSTEDEPDIFEDDLTGAMLQWIDVGVPDERRIVKASRRSESVAVYAYGNGALPWWKQSGKVFASLGNVSVCFLPSEQLRELASLAQRTMQLQLTVQEGQLWLSDQACAMQLEPARWLAVNNVT
ncbi:MAG: hypothetical protein K0S28_1200 [Paucimonas sp.]|nr:hypothetical protein [Paucimonas sp.]